MSGTQHVSIEFVSFWDVFALLRVRVVVFFHGRKSELRNLVALHVSRGQSARFEGCVFTKEYFSLCCRHSDKTSLRIMYTFMYSSVCSSNSMKICAEEIDFINKPTATVTSIRKNNIVYDEIKEN